MNKEIIKFLKEIDFIFACAGTSLVEIIKIALADEINENELVGLMDLSRIYW